MLFYEMIVKEINRRKKHFMFTVMLIVLFLLLQRISINMLESEV